MLPSGAGALRSLAGVSPTSAPMADQRLDRGPGPPRRTVSSNIMNEKGMTPEAANQGDGAAFGETAQHVNLNELATRMSRELLRSVARGDGHRDSEADAELGEMLLRACRAAHEAGLHAEHLVIILKNAWTRVPTGARGRAAEESFNRLVALSIDEFYRME